MTTAICNCYIFGILMLEPDTSSLSKFPKFNNNFGAMIVFHGDNKQKI